MEIKCGLVIQLRDVVAAPRITRRKIENLKLNLLANALYNNEKDPASKMAEKITMPDNPANW